MDDMFDLTHSFFMSKLSDEKRGIVELMLKHNAFVDPHSDVVAPNWTVYIEGYKNAADYLVDNAVKVYPSDMLIYPIIFLYRQYLELQLKDLLQLLYKYHNLPCDIPNEHELVKIWCKVRPCMERMSENFWGLEHYDHIEARIKEFDLIDKKSDAFRYPLDRKGNLSLDNIGRDTGDRMLNIFVMKCIMNSIYEVFQSQSETLYMEYGVE